jgi:hypothetical protein
MCLVVMGSGRKIQKILEYEIIAESVGMTFGPVPRQAFVTREGFASLYSICLRPISSL